MERPVVLFLTKEACVGSIGSTRRSLANYHVALRQGRDNRHHEASVAERYVFASGISKGMGRLVKKYSHTRQLIIQGECHVCCALLRAKNCETVEFF
jgi:hypothetical protein